MQRYLVVANQTLGGEHLVARVRELAYEGPCSFHIVVPVTPPTNHAWTEGEIRAVAQGRLDRALARFREEGADATGEVGDANPVLAVEDALRVQGFDEIIVSTLPPGISRWLKLDLPHRVEAAFGLPVTHVVGEAQPAVPP
ncbi:MAG: hypothetical protein ACRDH0_04175 [Actinomycetota bacterium]